MKVLLKEVGKDARIVDSDYKYRCDCVKLISCERIMKEYVELLSREIGMVVDEEGWVKDLPTNFLLPMNSADFPVQEIKGTVVFYRYKWENPFEKELWDFELLDLTDADIQAINRILAPQFQHELRVKLDGNPS